MNGMLYDCLSEVREKRKGRKDDEECVSVVVSVYEGGR